MKLSPNFYLRELTKSGIALRNEIDNIPNSMQIENLKALAINVLQPIRNHFGLPVIVNSGFRGQELERILTKKSYERWCKQKGFEINETTWQLYFARKSHPRGEASDIEIIGIANIDLAYWIRDNLVFDQLILEFYDPADPSGGWVHVSFKNDGNNRNEILTISKGGTIYGLPDRHITR